MAVAKKGEMFHKVKIQPPTHNIFDMSHDRLMTTEMARLNVIYLEDVVPSDRFKLSAEAFIRMAPMQAPIMHELNGYYHFFFVPKRILNGKKYYENFLTGGEDGNLEVAPHHIKMGSYIHKSSEGALSLYNKLGPKSLWFSMDYPFMSWSEAEGLMSNDRPSAYIPDMDIDPLLAYHLIYSEYYRDQNLQEKPECLALIDMEGDLTDEIYYTYQDIFDLHYRAKEKDYFTSALPEPQRGIDVKIPMAGSVSIEANDSIKFWGSNGEFVAGDVGKNVQVTDVANGLAEVGLSDDSTTYSLVYVDGLRGKIDETTITANINDLRYAMRLQEFFELSARVGNRLNEVILGNFGTVVPDFRLDRPQYLGGMKFPLQISQVLQTSESSSTPLGDMAGHGIAGAENFIFDESFYEHGYIIGIFSIMPRTSYYQGCRRMHTKMSRFDYFWDKFAHLGEQDIYNYELYFDWTDRGDSRPMNGTFGYQSRYVEYKYRNNAIKGDFVGTLKYWHLAEDLTNATANLSEDFVTIEPKDLTGADGYNRIFAVTDNDFDHFYCQHRFKVSASRPMPIFGTPYL